jgi:hypothetical protein
MARAPRLLVPRLVPSLGGLYRAFAPVTESLIRGGGGPWSIDAAIGREV